MSRFYPMDEAVAARADLSLSAKAVHAVISGYSRMGGGAFPSQARIAQALSISERSVGRAIKDLQAQGLLSVKHRGIGNSNLYGLPLPDKMSDSTGQNVRRDTDKMSDGTGQIVRRAVGQNVRVIDASLNRAIAASETKQDRSLARVNQWRESLQNFAPNKPSPDDRIIQQIMDAVPDELPHGDLDLALGRLKRRGLDKRMQSWAVLIKALPEELQQVQANSEPLIIRADLR